MSRASVQIIDLLLQPSDVILDTTPNFRGSTAEAVLLGGEHGRHLSSGIVDADGLDDVSFTYQWLADDTEIAGATGLTYTVAAADEGKAIKVEVSFTDDVGNDESLTSAANGCCGGPAQLSCHRSTNHQWHGAGGRDADG